MEVRQQGDEKLSAVVTEGVRPSSKRRSDFPQLFLPLLMTSRSNGRMELARVTEQVRFLSSHL